MNGKELRESLPAPQLPQMSSENVISTHQTEVGDGVFIVITEYTDPAKGDYVEVFWDNQSVREVLVDDMVAGDFPTTVVVTEGIGPGAHTCYYSVKDARGNTNQSATVGLTISDITPPAVIYPAPVFVDAISGVITQDSLTENGGTHVHVSPYQGITVGDTVILYWNGYSDGVENVVSDVLSAVVM